MQTSASWLAPHHGWRPVLSNWKKFVSGEQIPESSLTELALRPEAMTAKRVFCRNCAPKSYLARASSVSFVFSGELDWISLFCRTTPCLLPALWPPGSVHEPDLQSINRMHLLPAVGERPHYCVTVGRCFQGLSKALFYCKVFLLAAVQCYHHLPSCHLTCVVLNWEIRNLRELSEQKVWI